MRLAALLLAAAALAASPAVAEPPAVATDIPPVQSLVARVMQGVGEPALILPPGASPHGYAMRPSEAAALADADLVVWMGPVLTPWLARAIDSLAPGAASLALLDADGTTLLPFRDGASFEHDEAEHGQDASGGDPDGHAHDGIDPHAWLDPDNAKAWLGAIADALAGLDPANAAAYQENAARARDEIDALVEELSGVLAPVRGKPFIVYHDAYHYFGRRFGIEAVGAIASGEAAPPGPARIAAIRDLVVRTGAACVFAEPELPPLLVDTVTEGTGARAATLDPLGMTLTPGPELYPQLLRDMAAALRDCLGDAGGG